MWQGQMERAKTIIQEDFWKEILLVAISYPNLVVGQLY